jgi:hypothetical protein
LTLNFLGFIRDDPLRPRHQRSIDAFFKPNAPIADPYTQLKTDIGALSIKRSGGGNEEP